MLHAWRLGQTFFRVKCRHVSFFLNNKLCWCQPENINISEFVMIHSFSLDESTQLQVRRSFRDVLPPIPAGHLSEAIAFAQGFKSHAALKAMAASTLPGEFRYAYLSRPQLALYLWEHGYETADRNRHMGDFKAPLQGTLPYAHRTQGPEWAENGPLIAYTRPRRLVECLKLVLREVACHPDRDYREPFSNDAHAAYEREARVFHQPGTLLEAVDERGWFRTVGPELKPIEYNFTQEAFLLGLNVAKNRYGGLAWINKGLADKSVSIEDLVRGSASICAPN